MQRAMVSVILVIVVTFTTTRATRLTGCPSRTLMAQVDDVYFNCFESSGSRNSSFVWTLRPDTGDTRVLSTCDTTSCTTPAISGRGNSYRYSFYSRLRFYDLPRNMSGLLTCIETLPNNTVLSASCRLNVTYNPRLTCAQDGYLVQERNYFYSHCYHPVLSDYTVKMTLVTKAGDTLDLATCSAGVCNQPLKHPNITTYSSSGYKRVYFQRGFLQRSHAGELHCSFTYNSTTYRAQACQMDIYNSPRVANCSSSVAVKNWSMTLHCDISDYFSTAGNYSYRVYEKFTLLKDGTNRSAYGGAYIMNYRTVPGLTSYTNSTDNKQFYRGRPIFSWPLSPIPGYYSQRLLYLHPPGTGYTIRDKTPYVFRPASPKITCEDSRCNCTSENLGSPEGRLIWLHDKEELTSGGYGVKELRLDPVPDTPGGGGSVTLTCLLDWIEPRTQWVTIDVGGNDLENTAEVLEDSHRLKWAGIGGGAVVAIVVVAIVVVLLIFVVRRRRLTGNSPDNKTPRDSQEDDEHTYTDLNYSASVPTTGGKKRPGSSPAKNKKQTYDNHAMEEQ